MSIPKNRPVLWQDLEELRGRFHFSRVQMCKCLGIPQRKWELNMRDNLTAQVDDKTVAMLARLYDDDKNLLPEEVPHDMREFYEEMLRYAGNEEIKKRHFGPLLGRSSGAGYAWLDNPSQRISKPVVRLIQAIKKAALNPEEKQTLNPFLVLQKYSRIEAAVSDEDPFVGGRWFKNKK